MILRRSWSGCTFGRGFAQKTIQRGELHLVHLAVSPNCMLVTDDQLFEPLSGFFPLPEGESSFASAEGFR